MHAQLLAALLPAGAMGRCFAKRTEGPMKCVDWSPDHLDGLIVIALLRANGLDAVLFGENFVRQDWFQILAYDGFRTMVPGHQVADARILVDAYRDGSLELPAAEIDRPACPDCGHVGTEPDPSPRRWLMLAYVVCIVGISFAPVLAWSGHMFEFVLVFLLTITAAMPGFIRSLVIGRYRCTDCRACWRERAGQPFFRQQRESDAALDALRS